MMIMILMSQLDVCNLDYAIRISLAQYVRLVRLLHAPNV